MAKPTPEEAIRKVEDALVDTKLVLTAYEARYGSLALDHEIQNTPETKSALESNIEATLNAKHRIFMLDEALKAAREQLKTKETAEHLASVKIQLNQVGQHLKARDAAFENISAAVAVAAEQYQVALQEAENARRACPNGFKLPLGAVTYASEVQSAVENEIWRLGAVPMTARDLDQRWSFPGGRPPTLNLRGNPKAITPLAEVAKKTHEFVRKVLLEKFGV